MNTLEGLLAMRELLAVPERWTKHSNARNANGFSVEATDPAAVCWCLVGAEHHIWPDGNDGVTMAILDALPARLDTRADFNDHRSTKHPDVLAVIDRAISSERAKASAS